MKMHLLFSLPSGLDVIRNELLYHAVNESCRPSARGVALLPLAWGEHPLEVGNGMPQSFA